MNKNLILYIGIGVAFVILIILVAALIVGKKKKTQSEQPIHKDYDPSIANDVNAPVTTTATTENQTSVAPSPVVNEEPKVEPELNFTSQPDMPQLSGEQPVANPTPVVATNPSVDTTPIMNIPTTPVEPTTPVSQVVSAEPVVAPVIETPTSAPVIEMPTIVQTREVEATPVVEPVQPVDTTPIMDIPTTPVEPTTPATQVVNAEPVVVPTVPLTNAPAVETPSFQNIGMVAEPLVEEPVVEEVKPVVEEVKPVVEVPVIIEEPHPEVAQTSEVQVLDNYEITLPEEQKAIEVSQNMNEKNIEKSPMFVMDMPVEEPVVVVAQPETISIDVPDIEEIQ